MEQPISRGEFNAAMHGMREGLDGVKDGLTRVEAKQDIASSQALETAREAGRNDARLEALEQQQKDDRLAAAAAVEAAARVAADATESHAKATAERFGVQDLWIRGTILLVLGGGLAFVLRLLERATN